MKKKLKFKEKTQRKCALSTSLSVSLSQYSSVRRVWTKGEVGHGVGHGLPYGLFYGLPVINFLKLGSALLLTCVNNMPHESVIPSTFFCSFGGVSLKFSSQTRGRLES